MANILIHTVKEFTGMDARVVEEMIEGEPCVSTIPVDPGFTNEGFTERPQQITGMNIENNVKDEGVVYFDIVFYVRTPDGLSKIIINIEAQKSEPTAYDVEMRALFYAAREVSSQLEREFSHQKYNDIKKVYSICFCRK